MRPLAIDLDQLTDLMEGEPDPKIEAYLDLETGRPVSLSTKVLRAVDTDDYRMLNHLTDKLRKEVSLASDIVFNEADRYAPIPLVSPTDVLRYMKEFAALQQDAEVKEALRVALDGKGAFRRFKLLLRSDMQMSAHWEEHKREAILAKMAAWLEELGFEAVAEPPAAEHGEGRVNGQRHSP